MSNVSRPPSDSGLRALKAKGSEGGDCAERKAREILLRMVDRAGRGEEHIDPAIHEIAAAIRAHEDKAIDRAFRAAWGIGGGYNWQLMHGDGMDKQTLNKAHGAWEAAQAVRDLRPRLMLPPPETEGMAAPAPGFLQRVLALFRAMLRWIAIRLTRPQP